MTSLVTRVVTTFYRRMVVVTKRVRAAAIVPADVAVEIRPLELGDLDEYRKFKPFQTAEEVEKRIERGHLCFAALHDGRIVHAGWAATGRAPIPYIHSDIVLEPRDFYIYDSYTVPDYRRAKLVISRSSVMHAYFAERGFERSYGVVAYMNRAGLSVLEPAGYRRIGMYGCVRLGALHRTWAFDGQLEPLPRLEPMKT